MREREAGESCVVLHDVYQDEQWWKVFCEQIEIRSGKLDSFMLMCMHCDILSILKILKVYL